MDLIIGAGISGLSYAAATGGNYEIIEAEDQIGGYCKTIYKVALCGTIQAISSTFSILNCGIM